MNNLMLDVDQAGELKAALRRGDWTNSLIKSLCKGSVLEDVRLVVEGKAEIVIKSILTFVTKFEAPAIAGKKTADCFTDKSQYYFRDDNLDSWLPADQSDQPESQFLVQELTQPATFKQAVESFLGVKGNIPTLTPTLIRKLKEGGHVTTLPLIESLIERQEDISLETGGGGNFFFVEDKKEGVKEGVSVVRAVRYDRQWYVCLYRLDGGDQWDAGFRFFFRNLDTMSL